AESLYISRILASIAFALLYYEFVLTIPATIERYWRGKFSLVSFFFFLNRYLAVFGHIPAFFETFGCIGATRCRGLQEYHRFLSMAIQAIGAALMLLRTYALYGRDRRVLALLLLIIVVGAVSSIWLLVRANSSSTPTLAPSRATQIGRMGCSVLLSQEEGFNTALAWTSILVFDATVFVLTLLQALKIGRAWRGGYIQLILRDGDPLMCGVHDRVLVVCYMADIMTYAPAYKSISTSTVTNVLSTTLITRLMLNIRDPKLREHSQRWGASDVETTSC
ncbi:hypothetical protein C2E23DRAFT_722340, partial [Lenzites betulinus]